MSKHSLSQRQLSEEAEPFPLWESAAADRDDIVAGSHSHKGDTSCPIRMAQRAITCFLCKPSKAVSRSETA
jgi:hypothetical protein